MYVIIFSVEFIPKNPADIDSPVNHSIRYFFIQATNDYFKKTTLQTAVCRPFTVVKRENEYDVRCFVKGGGSTGQVGAIIHGIARALVEFEPSLKPALKKEKLTTRESRAVERKKYGHRKARRSFQFSKR